MDLGLEQKETNSHLRGYPGRYRPHQQPRFTPKGEAHCDVLPFYQGGNQGEESEGSVLPISSNIFTKAVLKETFLMFHSCLCIISED